MDDYRLKLYVVMCHVDKPLQSKAPYSCFEIPIQAGAALTETRVTDINDMDDCETNISDRNSRYSEASAMYWVYKHIDSPYVGILHYRRRLDLTDEDYVKYMDQGVDLITTEPGVYQYSIKDLYTKTHYASDWYLFMSILKRRDPGLFSFAEEIFDSCYFHQCNINVFKAEYYQEFCDWAFPILEEFYYNSPEKTDVYLHRDVGFIAERLSHLFVSKMKHDGKRVIEAPLLELPSGDNIQSECDYNNNRNVMRTCERLFIQNQIYRCERVIGKAIREYNGENDPELKSFSQALITGILERGQLSMTMFEYLPFELRSNLNTFLATWNGLIEIVRASVRAGAEEGDSVLNEYLSITHFSEIAVNEARIIAIDS